MKTSYKKAFEIQGAAVALIGEGKEETVFTDALNDILDQIEPLVSVCSKMKPRIQRKYAIKDPRTGELLKDEHKDYTYTEEGANLLDDEWYEFFEDENAVYLKPSFISETDLPKDLPRFLRKILTGLVIEPKEAHSETSETLETIAAKKLISKTK